MIPALVLTAGLATRLRPLSLVRAKAAMPVAGLPIVSRILRYLHEAGVRNVVLNLHHLPHTITGTVGDGSELGLRVRYSWETPILGSGGGPRLALPLVAADTFLIVNGDTLTNVDIPALVDDHRRSGALVTLAVVDRTEPAKYGGVAVAQDGVVTGFAARGSVAPSYHFVGVQVVQARAFASAVPGTAIESVSTLYPALMRAEPGSVRAQVCRAEFFDIGTPGDYLRTNLEFSAREPASPPRGARGVVHSTARVEQSVLWDDVEIGSGCSLRHCIVADRVRVPEGTSWDSVTIRAIDSDLFDSERRMGDLAVATFSHDS